MRIVQTFWTAGRDPLKYAFGWSHPEYNLMSWALSCLSLREHYDEVALYTDQEGYDVLINKLHLPYTEVNVVYDKNLCLPHHWAYAKIKTYSMQTKPFIHVDGDVYLPHPIPEDIANAPLIAQNKEIGTNYYRDMMYRVLHNPQIRLPECVQKGLQEDSIASYNMGVFGGNDLQFIQQYCNEVQKFFDTNGMNNAESVNSRIECNVFFEQILLAALVEEMQKKVGCIVKHDMYDQSYTISEFCNLYKFYEVPLHHLLGGHKRNEYVRRLLRHFFAYKYPEQFREIYELSRKKNLFSSHALPKHIETSEIILNHYSNFLDLQITQWYKLSHEYYIEYEASFVNTTTIDSFEAKLAFACNPCLGIYTFQTEKKEELINLRKLFHLEVNFPIKNIAVIPDLIGCGYEAVPLIPMDMEIIETIKSGVNYPYKIRERIFTTHKTDETGNSLYLRNYIVEEINHLIENSILIVTNN